MITNEQWELIDKKYGKLLTTICTKISGDAAIANFDDNLQDLRLAAMDAVSGFSKKEDKPFEEFWGTIGFNKYMKTCLWNLKNKKGGRISKRYNINKNTVDIVEYSDILVADTQDTSPFCIDTFLSETNIDFSEDQINLINLIVDNPTLIKPNGKINIRQASTLLGCCTAKARKQIESVRNKINLNL